MNHLTQSPVVFHPEDHTYHLGERQLSGITALLDRQLFPDTYADVSEAVLSEAADYGNQVHASCEAFDALWQNDGTQEVADYIQLCKEHSLVHAASEYLVSDNLHFASMIDKVYRAGDDTYSLGDIKTYGQMTPEKLEKARWQLSIYAYLFELQNKKAKAGELFVLHIRNKPKQDGMFDHIAAFIPLQRIPSDICKDLMETDLCGGQFISPFGIPDEIRAQEETIRQLILTKQETEEKLAAIKADILGRMETQGINTWATETMRITRKRPSTRSSFNLNLFRQENPDFDTQPYMRVSQVASSLSIAI